MQLTFSLIAWVALLSALYSVAAGLVRALRRWRRPESEQSLRQRLDGELAVLWEETRQVVARSAAAHDFAARQAAEYQARSGRDPNEIHHMEEPAGPPSETGYGVPTSAVPDPDEWGEQTVPPDVRDALPPVSQERQPRLIRVRRRRC